MNMLSTSMLTQFMHLKKTPITINIDYPKKELVVNKKTSPLPPETILKINYRFFVFFSRHKSSG